MFKKSRAPWCCALVTSRASEALEVKRLTEQSGESCEALTGEELREELDKLEQGKPRAILGDSHRYVFVFLTSETPYEECADSIAAAGWTTYASGSAGADGLRWASMLDGGAPETETAAWLASMAREAVTGVTDRLLQRYGVRDTRTTLLELAAGPSGSDPIPTGNRSVDHMLGGGLPAPGLVVIGAQSSVGKTSYALQVADTVAQSGRPVLFVTIEQGKTELVSKSIARVMEERSHVRARPTDITTPRGRKGLTGMAVRALENACSWYAQNVVPNMHVMEVGHSMPTVTDVRTVAEVIQDGANGVAPLIVIDYLQLLAPPRDKGKGKYQMTDKEITDRNVTALRHLARDTGATVLAISSVARSKYEKGAAMDAFKESGAIEYGADMVLFLTPAGIDLTSNAAWTTWRSQSERRVKLTLLKNRLGVGSGEVEMTFDGTTGRFF